MGKPYSIGLREQVVAAVERGGMSCHRAAAQFGCGRQHGYSLGSALPRDGRVAPGQMGGTSRSRLRASTVPGC